jgi:hypothetical protein
MPTQSGVDHLTAEYIDNRYDIPFISPETETTGIRTPSLVLMGYYQALESVGILPVLDRAGAKMRPASPPGRPKAVFLHNPPYPFGIDF